MNLKISKLNYRKDCAVFTVIHLYWSKYVRNFWASRVRHIPCVHHLYSFAYVGFVARARDPAHVHLNGPVRQCCNKSLEGTRVPMTFKPCFSISDRGWYGNAATAVELNVFCCVDTFWYVVPERLRNSSWTVSQRFLKRLPKGARKLLNELASNQEIAKKQNLRTWTTKCLCR